MTLAAATAARTANRPLVIEPEWVKNAGVLAQGAKAPRPDSAVLLPLNEYDIIIVMFSGGKDSIACVLDVLRQMDEQDVPRENLELWHQCIDGEPGSPTFMDWPVTEGYCKAFADAMGLTIRFQWKEGGFLGEMNRDNQPTARTGYELPDGTIGYSGGKGPNNTRRKFPQVAADLKVRWCSAYLKIDVGATAIRRDPRLQTPGTNILVVTGERWEESSARSRYARVEKHRTSSQKRNVHQYRPVLDWNEAKVWAAIRAAGINAHPCYALGYSRASCATCIFGGAVEWATIQELAPQMFSTIADKESEFGLTIHRTLSVVARAAKATSFISKDRLDWARKMVMGTKPVLDILVPVDQWELPVGAFRHTAGPC